MAVSGVRDGGPLVCDCRCFPGVDVCGGVPHHAPCYVWSLPGGHRDLHPGPGQNPEGKRSRPDLIPTVCQQDMCSPSSLLT